MGEIVDTDIREAALREEHLMASGITDRDMAFDLPEDAPCPEALHEILSIRRVQVQGRAWLQRAVDGADDTQELVVVNMLREVQREPGVEVVRALNATMSRRGTSRSGATIASARRADERPGEVDATYCGRGERLLDDAVPHEVGLTRGWTAKRQHASHALTAWGRTGPHSADRRSRAVPLGHARLALGCCHTKGATPERHPPHRYDPWPFARLAASR
jgi:hypothetical protein